MSSSHSQKRTLTTIFSSCALFISSEHCTSTSFADCPSARSALPMPARQSVSLTVATATQLSSSSRQANSSFITESSCWDVCGDFLRGNRGRKSEGEGEGKEREKEERRREGEGEGERGRGRERGQEREGEREGERGRGKMKLSNSPGHYAQKKKPPQKTQTSDTYRCRPRGASSGRFLLLWRHFRAKKIVASFQYGRPGFYRVVGYE